MNQEKLLNAMFVINPFLGSLMNSIQGLGLTYSSLDLNLDIKKVVLKTC